MTTPYRLLIAAAALCALTPVCASHGCAGVLALFLLLRKNEGDGRALPNLAVERYGRAVQLRAVFDNGKAKAGAAGFLAAALLIESSDRGW